jgi:predicted DsbA family dithiol-disulfide isomerase
MPSETVTVFFDYLCPFAWRAAELAERVAAPLDLRFSWSHFSLYQANHPGGDGWQLWNERVDPSDPTGGKGLMAFLGSTAARRQGEEAFGAFRLGLLRARHRDHRPLDRPTVLDVAADAGLHMACFERELADPEARTHLAKEHHEAAALHVFGTPTLRFPSGDTAYLRLKQLPEEGEASLELFRRVRAMLVDYPYLETLKRPRHAGN